MTAKPARGKTLAVITAGLVYFLLIFSLAFVMGVVRALVVAPRLGETTGVFLEIPILLIVSWLVARRLVRNRSFSVAQLISVGAIALVMTMISEAMLANLIRSQSTVQWATELLTPLGLVGLAGQLGFAITPYFAGRPNAEASERPRALRGPRLRPGFKALK